MDAMWNSLLIAAAGVVENAATDQPPAPAAVIEKTLFDVQRAEDWFVLEERHLMVLLIGGGVSILVGLGIGWLLHWLLRLQPEAKCSFRVRLARALAGPAIMLLTLVGVFLFAAPVLNSLPKTYGFDLRLFLCLVLLIASWGGFHLVELLAGKMRLIAQRDTNTLNALMVEITRKSLKVLILGVLVLVVLQSLFGINVSALLAGAGVAGLAVAFAGKDMLANFFGTLVILFDRPFMVGDRIKIGGGDGIVLAVGMRSTRLRTERESIVTIPNSAFTSSEVENVSRQGTLRYIFTVTLDYAATPAQLRQATAILHGIVDDFHGPDQSGCAPHVFFSALADWSQNIEVIMWLKTDDFQEQERWVGELNLAIVEQFAAAGIPLAFPTSVTYVGGRAGTPVPVQSLPAAPAR